MRKECGGHGDTAYRDGEGWIRDSWNAVLRNWHILLASAALAAAAGTVWALRAKPTYRATAQLLIEKEKSGMDSRDEEVDVDTAELDYYQTQYKLLRKRGLAKKVYDRLRLGYMDEFRRPGADPLAVFQKHVIVEPVRGSRLVNVSARSKSPVLAARIANLLSEEFVAQNLENRLHASREILHKLPRTVAEGTLIGEDPTESLPSVINNPLIQNLKNELVRYEAEYMNLSRRYREKHPVILTAQARIDYLKREIGKETRNAVRGVKISLAGGLKANNVRIVERANVPVEPAGPKKGVLIALMGMLGLLAGVGIVYVREETDESLRDEPNVEQCLDLPCLGIVPVAKHAGRFPVLDPGENRAPAEAVKMLRTNIGFFSKRGMRKVLLITSASSGSGKSLLSLNIAASFGQLGGSVLLVDADLRRGGLTRLLEPERRPGLSDYLAGAAGAGEIVRAAGLDNLSFIPAGALHPNPAELLGSERMQGFIGSLKPLYHTVIIDSAPVIPVSDTLNIAALVDGVIYVVYCGKQGRETLAFGKKRLEAAGAKFVGAVLNRVPIGAPGYGYTYHEYGSYH